MLIVHLVSSDRTKCSHIHTHLVLPANIEKNIIIIAHLMNEERRFPGGSDGKESACDAGDLVSIPGSGRCPVEGNGNPHQYSCLENTMDRGA